MRFPHVAVGIPGRRAGKVGDVDSFTRSELHIR